MVINLHTILILLAVIAFFLAACGVPTWRVNMIALGLFLWALDHLLGGRGA